MPLSSEGVDIESGGVTISNPSETFVYQLEAQEITANQILNLPLISQTETLAVVPQVATASIATRTNNNNNSIRHAAIAVSINPRVTGRVFITLSGTVLHGNSGRLLTMQLRYGTGVAPALNDVATGTLLRLVTATQNGNNNRQTFSVIGIALGLVINTPIWIDLAYGSNGAGTTTIENLSVNAFEI